MLECLFPSSSFLMSNSSRTILIFPQKSADVSSSSKSLLRIQGKLRLENQTDLIWKKVHVFWKFRLTPTTADIFAYCDSKIRLLISSQSSLKFHCSFHRQLQAKPANISMNQTTWLEIQLMQWQIAVKYKLTLTHIPVFLASETSTLVHDINWKKEKQIFLFVIF